MADYDGDPTKQPSECKPVFTPSHHNPHFGTWSQCPNLYENGGGMESERYKCDVCGKYYTLYYEDMA
jgi:hypothetical protein